MALKGSLYLTSRIVVTVVLFEQAVSEREV